ncbi:betaine/carnitine transporter, BCCT family [Paracoccus aminovorans]|uniref:Betaine/carnitine transporter, BCCT family n=1 Tax=Paracoccus aminovorans TaxID=34004 RepID=A0A1I3AN58_9RHOB|nr:BCCT family transporter [Paracoccus aminovorans]CQR84284.1 choline/carnitine/betaine transporter [Paracoccus aminovorans]SFH51484.1 betaine/carnitine transporter, BCCT family [Paracoccus aminovorans]
MSQTSPSDPLAPDAGIEALPPPEGPTQIIPTDYQIGQDNIEGVKPVAFDIHNPVFMVSGIAVVIFTAATLLFPTVLGPFFGGLRDVVTGNFDWFFLIAGNVFVLLCLFLILSPLGSVRLGGPEATPDFTLTGWFSMLFAAGMGIGLMFYGVSEPLGHYTAALGGPVLENGARTDWAPLDGAPGDELGARRLAMAATIFHWGLRPWAIYAVVALALALFAYNKGLPLTLRSVFYPIFGEKVWGWPGHVVDVLAVMATLFGLATSLGIGAEQASAGFHFLFGWSTALTAKIVLIVIITAVATTSVVLGVEKGVKRLSEINMLLAIALLLFVILVGPKWQILTGFFGNLGAYAGDLIPLSNPFGRNDDNFRQGWTAFYWAWWISWSPFVGMFIARVSRGRSVRQFLTAVLIVPSLISVLWMTAFGGTAITLTQGGFSGVADAALELQLFQMLSQLPLTAITSFVGIILVIVFFVTSSDSGSLVIDTIAAGGKIHAPVPQRIFWCGFEGLVAIALLLGGGLTALQAMAVSTGLPFTLVLLGACWAIVKGLLAEKRELR